MMTAKFSIPNLNRWTNMGETLPEIADKLSMPLSDLVKEIINSYTITAHAANLLAKGISNSELASKRKPALTKPAVPSTKKETAPVESAVPSTKKETAPVKSAVSSIKKETAPVMPTVPATKPDAISTKPSVIASVMPSEKAAIVDTSAITRDVEYVMNLDKLFIPRIVEQELYRIADDRNSDSYEVAKQFLEFCEKNPEKITKLTNYVVVSQEAYDFMYKKRSLVFVENAKILR